MPNSRIKRRNKCGFLGIGSYNYNFHENRSYGALKIYENKEKTHLDSVHDYFVRMARKWGARHPGSKFHRQLLLYLKPAPGASKDNSHI